MTTDQEYLRTQVRSLYDVQKLRIQMGNRLVKAFKGKLGIGDSVKEETKPEAFAALEEMRAAPGRLADTVAQAPAIPGDDEPPAALMAMLQRDYEKLAEYIKTPTPKQFEAALAKIHGEKPVMSKFVEWYLCHQYFQLAIHEKKGFLGLEQILQGFPVYVQFLANVRGCGPALSAVLLSEIDIHKARYPSSLWSYTGYDVAPDGKGRSSRKEHLVEREYTDRAGKPATKMSLTHKRWLKTKLHTLAECLIKAGVRKSSDGQSRVALTPYAQAYLDYKHRLEHRPDWQEKTPRHRHLAARRYMIKLFLRDLYNAWRPLEGLEVHPPYHEAKLGIYHKAS